MASVRPTLVVVGPVSSTAPTVAVLTCGPVQIQAPSGTVEKAHGGCVVQGPATVTNIGKQLVSVAWSTYGTYGCAACAESVQYGVVLQPGQSVELPSPPDGAAWYVLAVTLGQVEAVTVAAGLAALGVLALAGYGAYALVRGRR